MPHSKGHLNPGDVGVEFCRFELEPALAQLVRHVWVVRWALATGDVRDQRVLGYPTFNVVIDASGASLAGADPRLFVKQLEGSGWTVGILLRPAAGTLLTTTPPAMLVGGVEPLESAPTDEIVAAMAGGASAASAASAARDADVAVARVLTTWLRPLAERVDHHGGLVNLACRLADDEADVVRTSQLAERLGVSTRTLERLVRERVGVSPKWLIECRRLQAAATTLFEHPQTDLTALALDLGYADYAHFSRRYKAVLGQTPRADRPART